MKNKTKIKSTEKNDPLILAEYRTKEIPGFVQDVLVVRLIFTVDLIAPVLHPAVPHVVADQLAGDAVRGVVTLELIRIVTRLNILETKYFNVLKM